MPGVPGGRWHRIEFFEAGALSVRPDETVSLEPVGAWIATEYAERVRPFVDALPGQ